MRFSQREVIVMKFTPHDYQKKAIAHILNHKFCALWLDMGL